MKKLLILALIVFCCPLFPATKSVQGLYQPVIYFGSNEAGTETISLDNAAETSDLISYSFIAPKSPFGGTMKLSGFRVYFGTATDTPEVTAYLYSDNAGVPNTVVTNGTGVESSAITSDTWVELTWGGTLPTLTEGTQYWIVLKCTTGTSVAITRAYGGATYFPSGDGGSTGAGSGKCWSGCGDSSTDAGSTWGGTDRQLVKGYRIKITDDTDIAYFGIPLKAQSTTMSGTAYRIDGTQETGFGITTPADTNIRVKAVGFYVRTAGTPGNLSLKMYTGTETTATATGNAIPVGNVSTTGSQYQFSFSTPVALSASTIYRFVLSAASGSNAANYYYIMATSMDNDAASIAMHPWGQFLCTIDGGTWDADTTDYTVPAYLILDTTDPFTACPAGGTCPGRFIQ